MLPAYLLYNKRIPHSEDFLQIAGLLLLTDISCFFLMKYQIFELKQL